MSTPFHPNHPHYTVHKEYIQGLYKNPDNPPVVEFFDSNDNFWTAIGKPSWEKVYQYRIKPRTTWAVTYPEPLLLYSKTKKPSTIDSWENGELGENVKSAKIVSDERTQEIQAAAGLQMISRRLPKSVIDAYKDEAIAAAYAVQVKAETDRGIKDGESIGETAEGWAQWCEARGNQMLANFLRKQASATKDAVPLSDADISACLINTVDETHIENIGFGNLRYFARAIESAHGITAIKKRGMTDKRNPITLV